MKAIITIDLGDSRRAEAVAKSLAPDNQVTPEIKIRTTSAGRKVQTTISIEGRIQTLIATIDDLLKCTQTAEKTLRVVEVRKVSAKSRSALTNILRSGRV